MDITGYVVLGSSLAGVLIAFFALAYAASKSLDAGKVVDRLKRESDIMNVRVKRPDLIQLNRAVKFAYKILKSPTLRVKYGSSVPDMIKYMLEVKKKMSNADWVHAENKNLTYLLELKNDSVQRLKEYA